jgi:hypothetical protein
MKLANFWPLLLPLGILPFSLAPASWADTADTMFPGTASASSFNTQSVFGSGAVGNVDSNGVPIGNYSQPVLGESNPGWGADQVNSGTSIPGPISDYPNWSSQTSRYGGNAPNMPHQQPIGVRGGLPQTTTRLIAPLNKLVQMSNPISTSGFEGQHSFGFSGGGDQSYTGVTSTSKGVAPQSGGDLPATSTGSVGLSITDGY